MSVKIILLDWDTTLAYDCSSSLLPSAKAVLIALKDLVLFSHNGNAGWLAEKAGVSNLFDVIAVGRRDRPRSLSKQWNWEHTIEELKIQSIDVDVKDTILFDDDRENVYAHRARGGRAHLVFWQDGITFEDIAGLLDPHPVFGHFLN